MKKWVKIKLGVMACMCSLSIQAAEIVFGKENFICTEIQHKIQEAPDFFHRMRQEGGKYILFDSPLKRKEISYVARYYFLAVFSEYWGSRVMRKVYETSLARKKLYETCKNYPYLPFYANFCKDNDTYSDNIDDYDWDMTYYIKQRYIENEHGYIDNKNSIAYRTRIYLPDRFDIKAYAIGIVDDTSNFLRNNSKNIDYLRGKGFLDDYEETLSYGGFVITDENDVFHPQLNRLKIKQAVMGFEHGIPLGEAYFQGFPIDIFGETLVMELALTEEEKIKLMIYQKRYPEYASIVSNKICEIKE